jgi:hypothetical protein
MNTEESFCNSTCEDQMRIAQRKLSALINAVTESFGPEQAKVSIEDWLDDSELMDSPPRWTNRDWRAVTVAASARLVNRLTIADDGTLAAASDDEGIANTIVPIVLVSRLWCDAAIAADRLESAQRKKRNLGRWRSKRHGHRI